MRSIIIRKLYCALGLRKIRFWSNVFSSKCNRSHSITWKRCKW